MQICMNCKKELESLLNDFYAYLGNTPNVDVELIDLINRLDTMVNPVTAETAHPIEKTAVCLDCGGDMKWCSGCRMYTKICCEEYSTCMCS